MQNTTVVELVRTISQAYGGLGWLAQVGLVAATVAVATLFGLLAVLWLPADHFSVSRPALKGWRARPIPLWAGIVLKNAIGIVILPMGIIMALPLVPGPGLVFILIGLSLLDFPGKRRLERRLLSRPALMQFINGVRARFRRPALIIDPP